MSSWEKSEKYSKMLVAIGRLSNLFASGKIPYINYRVTENLFCKYCNATNLARGDVAYDAKIGNVGIGIKTFQLKNGRSVEKIAEFNKLSPSLRHLEGMGLATKLAEFRNERMQTANDTYGIKKSHYHIIGRTEGHLEIFDTPYDFVDIDSLKITGEDERSLHFKDKNHYYVFNRSKSVLMKRFISPENSLRLPVEIIDDPYELLEKLISEEPLVADTPPVKSPEQLILPLFSVKGGERHVPEKSGLNTWNAKGRERHPNEAYISVPRKVHREHPDFFPGRDTHFLLKLPDEKETIIAKICQDGGKALMSDPNKDLGEWILRKVLRLEPGELLTYDKLLSAGFDSVKITKIKEGEYSIDVTEESYDADSSTEE